jgi:hypothetical protein
MKRMQKTLFYIYAGLLFWAAGCTSHDINIVPEPVQVKPLSGKFIITENTPLVHRISASITLPPTLPPGTYQLGLWIPDGAAALAHNPRYVIRCANSDVEWFTTAEGYGINRLTSISVD